MRIFQQFICLTLAALAGTSGNATLLSPTEGTISEVMIAVPPDDMDKNNQPTPFAKQLLEMVARALGPGVTYIVNGYARDQYAIEKVLRDAGVSRFRFAPSAHGDYTRWTRDMFLVDGKQISTWMLPRRMPRRLDRSVGAEVASHIGRTITVLPVRVDGGNIIAFDKWVFAGKDLLLTKSFTIDEEKRKVLQQEIAPDSNWVWIGNHKSTPGAVGLGVYQPLFHIDMFITPLDAPGASQPHVVVGSTTLADRVLAITQPRSLARRLDKVATYLRYAGFSVSRIPLVLREENETVSVISYNNVLLSGSDSKTVLLPQFGPEDPALTPLDEQAANQFRALGYTVRQVSGPLLSLAQQLGGLRCLIQVTERR